jgi:hypothetical protein
LFCASVVLRENKTVVSRRDYGFGEIPLTALEEQLFFKE